MDNENPNPISNTPTNQTPPSQVVAVSVGENGGGNPPPQPGQGGVTALGVIATVLGSLALLGSFIPCLGALAIYIAIPAAICGIIGIILAYNKKVSMTLSIVGTVLSVIACAISVVQIAALEKSVEGLEELGEEIDSSLKEMDEENKARIKELESDN